MAEITLIASSQAKDGFEFVFQGAAPVCRTCPYRHACLTLDPGRRYAVTKVRPVTHPCALQETAANVVEVQPIARTLVVDSRSADRRQLGRDRPVQLQSPGLPELEHLRRPIAARRSNGSASRRSTQKRRSAASVGP